MMKKKFKNKELEEILNHASHLGNYAMPGDLTLAVIGSRKKIRTAYETYTDACKQIGESRCEKDKLGRPVTAFLTDESGRELINQPKKLKFPSEGHEKEALEELKKLGEQEIEIEVKIFDGTLLASLKNITPIQMEALMALVEFETMY